MVVPYFGIVSINVGKPTNLVFNGKELSTGINKKPVTEPIFYLFFTLTVMVRRILFIMAAKIKRYAFIHMIITLIGRRSLAGSWKRQRLAKI
jgi:hypothetical protein